MRSPHATDAARAAARAHRARPSRPASNDRAAPPGTQVAADPPVSSPVDRAPRVVREFPVTSFLVLPYAALIFPQAVIFGNPETHYILSTFLLAVVPAFVIELLSRRAAPSALPISRAKYGRSLFHLAVAVSAVGALSSAIRAYAGVGSVYAQVGLVSSGSALTTVLSVFTQWPTIGLALAAVAHLVGRCSRKEFLVVVAAQMLVQGASAALLAITAPFFNFAIATTILFLYLGVIGVRHCLVVGAGVLVAWPTIFALRNEARRAGGVDVSARVDAFERLRYDLQITRGADLGPGADIATPDLLGVIRYGLIPRFLDGDRPPLSTGNAINVALGGSAESSFNFLPVATAYVLDGPGAVVAVYAAWALGLRLFLRSGWAATPLRLSVLGLALAGPLGWFATYPDTVAGFVQGLVSLVPVAAALAITRRQGGPPPADGSPRSPHGAA